jgi:magnesium transporter
VGDRYGRTVTHRTRVYRAGELVEENFDPARISDYLEEDDTVVWLDLCEPERADLGLVAEEFRLSPLAVDDALSGRQRPKVDHYDDHLFLSLYGIRLTEEDELRSSEMAVFVSSRFLITIRKDGRFDMDRVVKAWEGSSQLAQNGISFLLWGLLDVLVDGHFEVVETLDDRLDRLEEELFRDDLTDAERRKIQIRSFALRKALVFFRRMTMPMREVVNILIRREQGVVNEAMTPYYQDVYDHVLRVAEWTDGLRDLVGSIVETNLTIQGNQLNEIMKKLTSYAALVAVPTAVTGFFGQNVHFPGFGGYDAFGASLALMVVLVGGLYWFLRQRRWL